MDETQWNVIAHHQDSLRRSLFLFDLKVLFNMRIFKRIISYYCKASSDGSDQYLANYSTCLPTTMLLPQKRIKAKRKSQEIL